MKNILILILIVVAFIIILPLILIIGNGLQLIGSILFAGCIIYGIINVIIEHLDNKNRN